MTDFLIPFFENIFFDKKQYFKQLICLLLTVDYFEFFVSLGFLWWLSALKYIEKTRAVTI